MDNTLIANLLIELLSEYNRVSLPCLGSFIGQYKPAYFSDDGATIYPPSKQTEFHQNEIWNDERLEKLIAERDNISLGEAKEKLAFWIDGICVNLSMGETVYLPLFGELVVSYGNRLKFIQYSDKNLLLESFGFENVHVDKSLTDTLVPPPPAPENRNNAPNNTEPPKKSKLWIWISVLAVLLLILSSVILIHFRIISLPDSILNKYPWVERYLANEMPDDRGLFPADNDDYTDYTGYVDSANYQTPVIEDTTLNAGLAGVLSDSTEMDGSITDSMLIPADSANIEVNPNVKYYIIAQSEADYNKASLSQREWSKKGYIVGKLFIPDEKVYKLSIGHFNTEEEAVAKLDEYKKEDAGLKNATIIMYSNKE